MLALADDEADRILDATVRQSQLGKDPRTCTVLLAHQSEEQVLGADVFMVQTLRFFARKLQRPPRGIALQ